MACGIKDVATAAGVSIATVSHVLNRTRNVSDATRRKVEKAMKDLEYCPNYLAKSLKENKSNVIGLVVPDISNFFFTEIAGAVEMRLRKLGYNLILCNTDENLEQEKQQIAHLQSYMVSGMIIAPTTREYNYRKLFHTYDYPVVFIDRRLNTPQGDCVYVDTKSVSMEATEYLISKGHKRIAFIGALPELSTTVDRFGGYAEALKAHGIPLDMDIVGFGGAKDDSGYEICRKLLSHKDVTALFVSTSMMSIGAMRYLVESNISIPDEIAIIGFDDYMWTGITSPPLSNIKQPTVELGERATDILMKRIEDRNTDIRNEVLKAHLIIRESC